LVAGPPEVDAGGGAGRRPGGGSEQHQAAAASKVQHVLIAVQLQRVQQPVADPDLADL